MSTFEIKQVLLFGSENAETGEMFGSGWTADLTIRFGDEEFSIKLGTDGQSGIGRNQTKEIEMTHNITTPGALIDAALDPNVTPVGVTAELLRGAVALIENEVDAASKAEGQDLVRRLRNMRAAAERLSAVTTDNTERARLLQVDLADIAAANSDQHILWLLAAAVMTAEQHAKIRAAFG